MQILSKNGTKCLIWSNLLCQKQFCAYSVFIYILIWMFCNIYAKVVLNVCLFDAAALWQKNICRMMTLMINMFCVVSHPIILCWVSFRNRIEPMKNLFQHNNNNKQQIIHIEIIQNRTFIESIQIPLSRQEASIGQVLNKINKVKG